MDASELKEYFARQNATERWQVLFEKDSVRLISPHGTDGDITISNEIADAAGLQHGRARAAAQLALMFEQAEQPQRGGGGLY
jgi:hypothetical protein